MLSDPGSRRRQAGFTVIEMTIALVLLLVGLLMAADLLMESSRLFVETSGEVTDTPVPLALARLRADIQGATAVTPQLSLDGKLDSIHIQGGPREVVYQKVGDSLYRTTQASSGGPAESPVAAWRRVTDWSCVEGHTGSPALLSITYLRRSTPHTPLPVMPVYRGSLTEEATEILYLLPRGNGW